MAPFEYPLSHHRWYLKLDMIRLAQKNIELRNRGDKGTITMENTVCDHGKHKKLFKWVIVQ